MRVVILGAAGRDFHDFNVVYRDDPAAEVVAFTERRVDTAVCTVAVVRHPMPYGDLLAARVQRFKSFADWRMSS